MRLLVFLVLFLYPSMSLAQVVNIEGDRDKKKEGLHGSIESGFTLLNGNIRVLQTQHTLRLDYDVGKDHLLLMGSKGYGKQDGKTFQNDSFAHMRWTSMWARRTGSEIFSQVQQDEFKRLTLRVLLGGGVRFALNPLSIGVGGMLDYEEVGQADLVGRASTYLSYFNSWGDLGARLVVYYQPLFSDPSDYRLSSVGAIEFKANSIFSLSNEASYLYDTAPPVGVQREDLQLRVKMKASW
jgi:hypothetical protein